MLNVVQQGLLSAILVLSVWVFEREMSWLEMLGYWGIGWNLLKMCVAETYFPDTRDAQDLLLIVGQLDARQSMHEAMLKEHLARRCRRKTDL